MDRCETVKIVSSDPKSQGPFVEINAEDFDDAVHVLYEDPDAEQPADPLDHDGDGKKGGSLPPDDDDDGLTKAEIHADLEALGVEFDPRAKKADLLALRNEARAARDAEKLAE